MNRLTECTQQANKDGRKVFCAYMTAGLHSFAQTEKLILGFEQVGVDILELGFPFSDPLADGPVIQEASYQALKKGVTIDHCCQVVARVRKKGCAMPIVFFSYLNPIMHYGIEKCVKKLHASGFDAVLCPDLPYGVDETLPVAARNVGLGFVRLLAPTNTPARIKKVAHDTDGFLYYVSRKGTTGTQQALRATLKKEVNVLKKETKASVLVGFGVSTKSHVQEVATIADGAIVGSAIVKKMLETKSVDKTLSFTKKLVRGCKP